MNVNLLRRRKKKTNDLERFYNRFLVNFTNQVRSLNADEVYRNGMDRFNAILNDAERQLKREQKRLRKKSWFKQMQKGTFFPKRLAVAKKYAGKKVPLFLMWADTQFSRVENFASGNTVKAQKWVKINYPKMKVLTDEREKWIKANMPKIERFAADRYMKTKDFVLQKSYQLRKAAS